ncbi:MAG: RNase J family beta-CASP ribonuclease [Candidatus Gracilibacteria bacterium]
MDKDKLSEWITRTIEQGDDRPIETPNLQKGKNSESAGAHKEPQNPERSNSQRPERPTHQGHSQKPFKKFQKGSFIPQRPGAQRPQGTQRTNPRYQNRPTHQGHPSQQGPKSHQSHPAHQAHLGHQAHHDPQGPRDQKPQQKLAVAKKTHGFRDTHYSRGTIDKPQKTPPLLPDFRGLRIIPIGGLNEIGKNLTIFEYNHTGNPKDKQILIIDMGLQFPEEDMLGVDYVIPDTSYLEANKKKIIGVVITHGHLDHIGGIPYILPKIDFPRVYATRLTKGLIDNRLKEFKLTRQAKVSAIDPKQSLKLGSFKIDFFRVAHSIPDSVGVIIDTPEGKIVHTGDFKFDDSPAGIQPKADLDKIGALGSQNVLALLSDSTNALKPGHTMSEFEIGQNLEGIIQQAKGRIIIASFSSLIGRIQQIFDYAEKAGRKIFVSGRSMEENIKIALSLGFLKIKLGQMHSVKNLNKAKDTEALILTTGSQGEAVSALTKISLSDHPHVRIKKGDTVVVSSTPIIGNERSIYTVINNLCVLGARVIHSQIMDIHTSGHGYQSELIQMIMSVKPKYFIPIHGEYFMRQTHKELAIQNGIPEQNCVIAQNGDVIEIAHKEVRLAPQKVPANYILIDGLGEGTIGSQVMVDRQKMSQNGIVAIILEINKKTKALKAPPNILSRGFTYMHEYEQITVELSDLIGKAYKEFQKFRPDADRKEVKRYIASVAEKYTHQKLERRPLIFPLVFES